MRMFYRACVIMLCVLACGCATVPYRPTSAADYPGIYFLATNDPEVVTGAPIGWLDASDWYWPGSLLSKLLLWNGNIDSHEISDETVETVVQFCREHELGDTKIRINGYQVADEWRRTFSNTNIHPFWRFPFGFLAWVQYTILPGRFFGGDNYNPYSNTINLYSDLKPVALHEAGHAQDFAKQQYKGFYAALYMVPFVNLYHEAAATSTALSYIQTFKPVEEQRDAYRLLYPAYSTYIGGNVGDFVASSAYWPIYLGSIAVGHIAGQTVAILLPEEPEQ